MRKAEIEIGEKTIVIKELRIGDLKKLFTELTGGTMGEIDKLFKSDLPSDATAAISGILGGLLGEKLCLVIPGLTLEDIENAYPSEMEMAIAAFIDVNFTGIKKVGAPLLKMMFSAPGLKPQPPSLSSTMKTQ